MADVSAQSFERAMHHEATGPASQADDSRARESRDPPAPGEKHVDVLSDRGSTPLASTNKKAAIRLLFYWCPLEFNSFAASELPQIVTPDLRRGAEAPFIRNALHRRYEPCGADTRKERL